MYIGVKATLWFQKSAEIFLKLRAPESYRGSIRVVSTLDRKKSHVRFFSIEALYGCYRASLHMPKCLFAYPKVPLFVSREPVFAVFDAVCVAHLCHILCNALSSNILPLHADFCDKCALRRYILQTPPKWAVMFLQSVSMIPLFATFVSQRRVHEPLASPYTGGMK